MATRRSQRLASNKLSDLDQFKLPSNDIDITLSDSNRNTNEPFVEEDDISSASSEYDGQDSEEEEEDSSSYSESESSESSEEQEDSQDIEIEEHDSNDHSSDSDFVPGKKSKPKAKKKPKPKKKKVNNSKKQTRGRKRKRSDEIDSGSDNESGSGSDSDGEYRPNNSNRQTRKKRKTKDNELYNNNETLRRSTRNLGRDTIKYDDRTIYGDIPGLYDSDNNAKEAAKKAYKNVHKKRKRGNIKKLKHKNKNNSNSNSNNSNSNSNNSNSNSNNSESNSISPNTKRKIKITHKAYNRSKSNSDSEYKLSQNDSNDCDPLDRIPKKPQYTYSAWLDDIVSDTECQYLSRSRLMPAKINHIMYSFEVQTEIGTETYTPHDGKMKQIDTNNDTNDDNDNGMEVDGDDNDDNDNRKWYYKLSIGDKILCLNEENEWKDYSIIFINRRYDLQYHMRKSLNEEEIYEYDPKTHYYNIKLKEKMRPSDSIIVYDTPEPSQSLSITPNNNKNKRKKKGRFGDSDESDDSSSGSGSGSEEEDSDEYSEDDDINKSRTHSVSPVDDLQTKIENILFKMKLPKNTVHYKDTFNHLLPNNNDTTNTNIDANTNVNGKQEMDVDVDQNNTIEIGEIEEDKENVSNSNNSMMIDEEEPIQKESNLISKYLVKYWNRSYHHCEWLTTRQLRELDTETKRTNFDKKFDEYDRKIKKINNAIKQEKYKSVHFFNDLYLEIDRIISYAEPNDTFDTVSGYTSSNKLFQINYNTSNETMFLVKWKGMQYDQATWEMESFLKNEMFDTKYNGTKEIELLIKRQKIPASRFLHPGPKKLNTNYFKHKPSKKERVEENQIFKNGHQLRGDYQKQGVNWLVNNWQYKTPCILADEMGLGKTVQTVTFVNWLYTKYNRRGPFLIVAPLSTLGHWQREFRAWSDLNVIVYHGSSSSRERIVAEEFEWLWTDTTHPRAKNTRELKKLNCNNFKFEVMITTPQIVNQDYKILNYPSILWNTIVVDEAHSLKSNKSLFYRTLDTFKNPFTHIVLLTGTPIQNNMDELWCLLHFMDPSHFTDQEEFVDKFSNLAESKNELKALLNPRLLQRLKYLVEKDLCQREEKIIWVELTLFQKKWYKALYQRSYEKLKACGAAKASLMNVAMQLRKCCNHPFLMTDVEKTMSPPGTDDTTMNENLIKSSGKLVLLDKLLPKLKREKHRILIFSQMSHLLDILEDYLNFREHLYERLDGSVTGIERQEAIDRFQKDDSIFVFLLTTRAGGVGINLMAADTVIIYDSDWNPMNDVQAIARCHRIGQKKQVNVYRLITRNCYEESMFKRADQKLALNKVVMGDMKDMGKSDINDMLKKGAIAMFLKDVQTDDDIKKFADADIDDILFSRTEIVKHDADTNDPDAAMFSEAVFVAHADDVDVNVDDENFWEVLGVGNEEEVDDIYTSPFMRRRTRLQTRTGIGGYDDEFQLDFEEGDMDDGTSLLGALSYIIYGKWEQMFNDLTQDEKLLFGLVKEEDSEVEKDEDDDMAMDMSEKKDEEKKDDMEKVKKDDDKDKDKAKGVEHWQVEIIKQASIETICKMANLMKPQMRVQKLGQNFSRLQHVFMNKEFRTDAIDTLARQIYETDFVKNDQWKNIIGDVWKIRNDKNRFVDKKQFGNRKYLCKMGCLRLNNRAINPNSGNKFDTCCSNCANSGKHDNDNDDGNSNNVKNNKKVSDVIHEPYCEKRHYNDWRRHIRDEALKRYLLKYPLVQQIGDNNNSNVIIDDGKDIEESSNNNSNICQFIMPTIPNQKEMIDNIISELKYQSTNEIVLSMRTKFINVKNLRDQLKNKTHGDIVSILLKLERMFKFKIMCGLNKGKIKKLDFSNKKSTKAMPEWWETKWNYCMVEGTLKYGWGNVPSQFAREQYEFTPTYKGIKKIKKPTKKQLEKQQKLKDIKTGIEEIKINEKMKEEKEEKKQEPPQIIVKKRNWVSEGKKQETILISICNHFRKEISEKKKKLTTKIKTANKLREQKVLHPHTNMHSNVNVLKSEMDDLLKRKKKNKKKNKKKHSKKNKFDETEFNKINDITNYFSMSNGDNIKRTNAFDILGKKKKKKTKYIKTKLKIIFENENKIKLPIKISKTKMVTNLGEICVEKGYHATSYIYPIGYKCVIAQLPSLKNVGKQCTFTTIIKKGNNGPLFELTCSDDKQFKLEAKNPSKIWGQLKQLWLDLEENKDNKNEKDNKNDSNTSSPSKKKKGISGPQKIGLAHSDIKRLIECLPNALKCVNYKFKYRLDKDETFSIKKAFRKTLKIRKDKNNNKTAKKPKKPSPNKNNNNTIINNVNNINNINIINNINSVSIINKINDTNMNNPILIEDSPNPNPTITNNKQNNKQNDNNNNNNNILSNINVSNNISLNASRNGSEVIDLCGDSDNNDENNNKNDKKIQKQSRKRKHPSNDDNMNAFKDDDDKQPKKKRRVDNNNNNNNNNVNNNDNNKQQTINAFFAVKN